PHSPSLHSPSHAALARSTSSLHDALPICKGPRSADAAEERHRALLRRECPVHADHRLAVASPLPAVDDGVLTLGDHHHVSDGCLDRKSTRLNSSHVSISYAVFCLKKKTQR